MEIAHGRHQPDALAARPERAPREPQVGNGLDDAHVRPSGSAGMMRRCRLAAAAIAHAGEQRSGSRSSRCSFANLWLSRTRLRNTRLMRRSEPHFARLGQSRVGQGTEAKRLFLRQRAYAAGQRHQVAAIAGAARSRSRHRRSPPRGRSIGDLRISEGLNLGR